MTLRTVPLNVGKKQGRGRSGVGAILRSSFIDRTDSLNWSRRDGSGAPIENGRPRVAHSDEFQLYDLRVEVVRGNAPMVCNHAEGDYFELSGENLSFPAGQTFPLYPLAAILPVLPAKQRETAPNDWMTTDMEIACPDPLCGARFRITRTGTTTFRHSDITLVPLDPS